MFKFIGIIAIVALIGFSLLNCDRGKSNTIIISGQVTDFYGNPIDSCWVALFHEDFSTAYEIFSDSIGHFVLSGVEKGRYIALYAIRLKEYPSANAVLEEDMRLEFWAWNVVADNI